MLPVIVAAVLFGTSGTAQALGPDDTTPLGVGTVRIVIGAITLWVLATRRHSRHPAGRTRDVTQGLRAHVPLVLVGGAGVAIYQPFFFAGVDRAGVALGTIVAIGSGPFFAGGLDALVRRRPPTPQWWIATVVTVAGGAWLTAVVSSGAEVDLVGVAYALASGFGYALYSVTGRMTIDRGVDPTTALAAPFTVGAVVLVVLSVGEPFGWLTTWAGVALALHLGVLVTGVAYALYGVGLQRLGAPTTVTLVLIEPVTAALLAWIVLDESLPAISWLAITVVLAGVRLATWQRRPPVTLPA